MQSQVNEISPVLVEVTVEVPWQRVEQDLKDTYREIAKTARVKGFRPGKVPQGVVRQVYGKQVKAQVTGSLIEQGLMHAVEHHELRIVSQPEVHQAPQLTQGKPLTFTAKVEVRPKIDKVEVDGLELWQTPDEIDNALVDDEVERLRVQHAAIQTPEPMRAAKDEDLVTIDYKVTIDGVAKDEMSAKGRQIELGSDQLLPELKAGLLGTKPGDDKVVTIAFPDEHSSDDLKGKHAEFHIKVLELHERLLPDLDDEFAKDCGDFETLLELRLKIREGLQEQAKQRSDSALRDQAIDKLTELNDVPVPPSMVKQQQQMMMYEMAQFMKMAGQQDAFGPEFFEGLEARAERRVRAGILLGAFAKQEHIHIHDEELEARFAEIAEQSGKNIAKVKADYQGEQRDGLESQLLEEKIMKALLARATIKEGEPPEAKKAAPKKKAPAKKKAATKKAPAKKAPAKKTKTRKKA